MPSRSDPLASPGRPVTPADWSFIRLLPKIETRVLRVENGRLAAKQRAGCVVIRSELPRALLAYPAVADALNQKLDSDGSHVRGLPIGTV